MANLQSAPPGSCQPRVWFLPRFTWYFFRSCFRTVVETVVCDALAGQEGRLYSGRNDSSASRPARPRESIRCQRSRRRRPRAHAVHSFSSRFVRGTSSDLRSRLLAVYRLCVFVNPLHARHVRQFISKPMEKQKPRLRTDWFAVYPRLFRRTTQLFVSDC